MPIWLLSGLLWALPTIAQNLSFTSRTSGVSAVVTPAAHVTSDSTSDFTSGITDVATVVPCERDPLWRLTRENWLSGNTDLFVAQVLAAKDDHQPGFTSYLLERYAPSLAFFNCTPE